MENNDNPQPETEKKSNFFAQFFPKGENESSSSPRNRVAELISENHNLKKQVAKLENENALLKKQAAAANARSASYATANVALTEQLDELKERFQ